MVKQLVRRYIGIDFLSIDVEGAALGGANIAIVVTHHDAVNKAAVLASASYVIDTTGKLDGAHHI
jgi:hypothetical protein